MTRRNPEPDSGRSSGRRDAAGDGAAKFDDLRAPAKAATLHGLLSRSPLNRLDFEEEGVRSPVRDACSWLTPASSPGSEPPRGGPPVTTLSELLRELDEQRSDR